MGTFSGLFTPRFITVTCIDDFILNISKDKIYICEYLYHTFLTLRMSPPQLSRDSSVGRASDWRSEGHWFDPGSWHYFLFSLLLLPEISGCSVLLIAFRWFWFDQWCFIHSSSTIIELFHTHEKTAECRVIPDKLQGTSIVRVTSTKPQLGGVRLLEVLYMSLLLSSSLKTCLP